MLDKKEACQHMKLAKAELGSQITKLRQKNGLTIQKMAFDRSIKSSYIKKLELKKLEISIEMLFHIARFFNKKLKIEFVE